MQKKWKKAMASTLSICMLATYVPQVSELGGFTQLGKVVQAATETEYKGTCGKSTTWEFDANTKTLTISGTGEMEDYDYDDSDDDSAPWMKDLRTSVEKIVIGDNITKVGAYAFFKCENLKHIYIGKSMNKLGGGAFAGCYGIEEIKVHAENKHFVTDKNVLMNKSKTKLYFGTFCENSTCYVDASVTKIYSETVCNPNLEHFEVSSENSKFYSEDGMLYTKSGKELLICPIGKKGTAIVSDKAIAMDYDEDDEETVREFYAAPFEDCAKLEKIIIGKNIRYLDSNFPGCTSLKEVEVDAENEYYVSVNGSILNRDQNKLYYYISADEDGTYRIPKNVKYVYREAFYGGLGEIKHIVLPDKMRNLDRFPYDVAEITLGKKYYNNGDLSWMHSFGFGDSKKVNIPDENPYYSIDENMVYDKNKTKLLICSDTTKVCKMPNTVTSVDENAFESYSSLKELYVSDSVTDMTGWFKNGFLEKLYIGRNVKKITPILARNLNTITVSSENENYKVEDNILYTKNGKKLVWCPATKEGTLKICEGTTTIGNHLF